MNNLTEGRPLRQILRFALPLLLGNLFQQTYNIVDAAIVGRCLGSGALASVGASTSVQFLVLGFCTGTCAGFAIPIAQHFGAKHVPQLKSCVFHALTLTGIIALALTALCAVLCGAILHLLQVPGEIFSGAHVYLLIIFLGMPFTLLYNMLASILRAIGDSRTPFLFLVLSTVLNVILDVMTIVLWHMGVAGAALATIFSQAVSGILCAVYIARHVPFLWLDEQSRRFSKTTARNMLMVGVPMGLQFSITAIGSMVVQSSNNALGSVYISGFTAAMKVKMFLMCPFDALGTGVATFCGQNYGARRPDRIRQGLKDGLLVGIGYGLASGLVLILLGRTLSALFVSEEAVLNAAGQYLRVIAFFWWCLSPVCVARTTTQALGFTGRAVISGVVEMFARTVVAAALSGSLGFTAICMADPAAWSLATAYITPVCYYSIRQIEERLKAESAQD